MKLGVVVLNWNGKDVTPRCLESLFRSVCPPDLVVVVDNASSDGSADLLREKFPQAALILNDSNLGFAEGCNVGMRYLLERDFELILLLNNDAVVDPDCLCQLKRAAQDAPAAAYGATIYELAAPGKVWYAGGTIDRLTLDARHETEAVDPKGAPRPTEFVTGCCMLFRAEALRRLGFLERSFFAYYEDVDWCLRAKMADERLVYAPAAVVQHDVSHSFRRGGLAEVRMGHFSWSQSQPLVLYLAYRNRLLLARKHARGALHRALLVLWRLARAALHVGMLLLAGRAQQGVAVFEGSIDGLRPSSQASRMHHYLRFPPL